MRQGTGNPAIGPGARQWRAAARVAVACAVLAAAGASSADASKETWLEIRSRNFVVAGNTPERDLRRAADDLEAFRAALGKLYGRADTAAPTRVVVLKDRRQFQRLLPRDPHGRPQQNVAGYFLPGPDISFIVFGQYGEETDRRVVLHEYAHQVLRRSVHALPLWLNEGLAEFYSTFDHDSPLAPGILGRPPGDVLTLLRDSEFVPLTAIVESQAPADLLSDLERARLYYAESWALVHYLMIERGGAASGQMARLIDALTRAVPAEEAFLQAFGVTLDRIDSELRKYIRRPTFGGISIDPGPRGSEEAAATPMSNAGVARVRGDLLLRVGTIDEAERELAASLDAEPANVEARIAMGRVMLATGRRDDARATLLATAAAAPDNFAAVYYLGGLLAIERRYGEAFLYFDRAVRLRPDSVSALFAFSSVALALGLDDASEEAMRLSMQLESNPQAYRVRAYAALGLGRDSTAARDALRYINTVGWHDPSAQSTAFVAAVAYWRSQRPSDAADILNRVQAVVPSSSWANALVQFMQGSLTAERLLSRAKTQEQRTAAHTYIGLKAELAGRRAEALGHFRWVKDQGTRQEMGYGIAIEELVKIETEERWW